MPEQPDVLIKRVEGNHELVDCWLNTRRQLLIAYYEMAGMKPARNVHCTLDEKALDNFCQKLVDYLSTGHFTLYECVIAMLKDDAPRLKTAAQLFKALQANTEKIMACYDEHFEKAIDDDNCLQFQHALSLVGEELETRFTLEDRLLALTKARPSSFQSCEKKETQHVRSADYTPVQDL